MKKEDFLFTVCKYGVDEIKVVETSKDVVLFVYYKSFVIIYDGSYTTKILGTIPEEVIDEVMVFNKEVGDSPIYFKGDGKLYTSCNVETLIGLEVFLNSYSAYEMGLVGKYKTKLPH